MGTHEYERPWQVMPAKIIKLALEHAQNDNDFDHQVAYLLLDIGVEAALKVYLVNRKHDVENIRFPELLKKVSEELSKTNSDVIQQIDDISYLHKIRNKLYHQGDGVKPTADNLKRYSDIARKVVEEVIQVNLETEEKKYVLDINGHSYRFEELIGDVEERFEYFQESCAIVTEKLHPNHGTREFALKLKYILQNCPDDEDDDPRIRIENQECRLEKFNELTGKNLKNHNFVDFVLKDINHLYVITALQETSDNSQDEWKQYINIFKRYPRLLSDWKQGIYQERLTVEQIRKEYQKIISWLESQQEKLDEWISNHMENIYRDGPPFGLFEAA